MFLNIYQTPNYSAMKTLSFLFSMSILLLSNCSSPDTKGNINKVGKTAGEAVGELVSGVTSGVEKAYEPIVELSPNLKEKGIEFGKILVSSDPEAKDNVLVVYMIFNQNFKGTLIAKAFDNKGAEMGRTKADLNYKKDETKYIEFHFDKRTNIDKDSKMTIE
jgi:hypothetical protein